jgi:hypothetical protein
MQPRDLKPDQFKAYPPEARKLATEYVGSLQRLPLSFLPSLLREVIDYDFKFPAERKSLEKELANWNALPEEKGKEWVSGFAQISLSPQLEQFDWVNQPAQFVEQLSAYLWTTHQMDAFRKAALDYGDRLQSAVPPEPPPLPRLGITVIGQKADAHDRPLFRKLRPQGAYFTRIKPENGMRDLLDAIGERAKSHPVPFGHWYIDGGTAAQHDSALTSVSYQGLEPTRAAILRRVRAEKDKPGMGPEALRTLLAQMGPAELGFAKGVDLVMERFQLKLFTEGSGTQVFSTTFAQWAAREALRRAQPCTLLVRFAPRAKPMNDLLSVSQDQAEMDPVGALIDADFGAYYNWLNQQRLPGADKASFLVWFEDHNEALAIGPGMPRGTESTSAASLKEVLSWIT